MIHQLLRQYIFLIPLVVGISAEFVKVISEGFERGAWHEGLFRSGGMPSSHSALVTSLIIVVAKKSGLDSVSFAITFVFACMIWYDAMSSRKAIGEQGKALNQLQKLNHFSERVGHSFREVVGGIIFGAAITVLGIWASN
jgi:acid phosphatase family membrane protein YuiD